MVKITTNEEKLIQFKMNKSLNITVTGYKVEILNFRSRGT